VAGADCAKRAPVSRVDAAAIIKKCFIVDLLYMSN
jgi:hypothetical protein